MLQRGREGRRGGQDLRNRSSNASRATRRWTRRTKAEFIERNRYVLSGIYIDLKKIDKATKLLKVLLEMQPDDPTYNNDLGYIWADHDMNLDEAEKMIRKALDEDTQAAQEATPDLKPEDDKDNAAYLDSLGWVLFKQKKYKEAKKFLEEAIKDKEGQHIEIFDHLGDVYKALGENKEAIATWKKGIESVEKRGNEELPPTKRNWIARRSSKRRSRTRASENLRLAATRSGARTASRAPLRVAAKRRSSAGSAAGNRPPAERNRLPHTTAPPAATSACNRGPCGSSPRLRRAGQANAGTRPPAVPPE